MTSLISILFICLQCCCHSLSAGQPLCACHQVSPKVSPKAEKCCCQSLCACHQDGKNSTAVAETQTVCNMNTEEITDVLNGFGFETFKKVATLKGTGDLFISPASLAIALAMTAGGAEGSTEKDMLSTLGLEGLGKAEAAQYFKTLVSSLKEADERCALEVANSIWIHKTLSVKDDFARECAESFEATAATGDFDRKATLDEINAWCSDKTHGKITSILDKLDSSIAMALLNALYFKGSWSFDWNRTKDGVFHGIDSRDRDVKMMHASDYMAFAGNGLFETLELPYGNGSFVLDILLPKEPNGFAAASAGLDVRTWKALEDSLSRENVTFVIPQFKIEDDIEMTGILKEMGMAVAFSDYADFFHISDTPLKIGMVKQKTFVDVNEKGTEAAAITFIGMKNMAMPPSDGQPRKFIADRPFIFLIRERSTGAVLFIGQKTR